MPNDKISVIIPTYNNSTSIERCIESVLNQSINASEIIVVNDGSTDNTSEILNQFESKIIYFEQSNQGQGAARNTGLKAATGEYIAFLDSDDYWLPDFIKITSAFLDQHPNASAINTGHIILKFGGKYFGPMLNETDKLRYCNGAIVDNFFEFWAKYDHIRTGTALIRKKIIDTAGFQREDLRISQDLEYWGYLATFGKWGFISEYLWVGDSASTAARKGWSDKYLNRRKLCPSVESWEKRITQRITREDRPGFVMVRGRVANSFSYNKLLGGDTIAAKNIVTKYGNEMPISWTSRAMKVGIRNGIVAWKVMCFMLRLREKLKSFVLYYFPGTTYRIIKTLSTLFYAKQPH